MQSKDIFSVCLFGLGTLLNKDSAHDNFKSQYLDFSLKISERYSLLSLNWIETVDLCNISILR